ncbi:MAG: TlpA family protein disulfide reductase [Acidobacteria bacterium]|nr:TlpA family protein disulfide reductase [Acidobacteriota bacterium]
MVEDMEQEQSGVPPDADAPPGRRKAAWIGMGALLVALVLLAFLSGPSGVNPDADQPPPAAGGKLGTATAADPDDVKSTGKPAPLQFTLKDMNGVDVKLASFKGKVILLNFWATWCGPCRAEIPSLIELQKQYADDLVVLGFSVDDPVAKLKPYAKEFQINYPILVGLGREDVQEAFGPLWGIPVSVIIARDGTIQKKHSGIASKEQFEREIRTALGV